MSHGVYTVHRIELSLKTFPMKKLQMFTKIRIKIHTVSEMLIWVFSVVRTVLIQASGSLVHCARCLMFNSDLVLHNIYIYGSELLMKFFYKNPNAMASNDRLSPNQEWRQSGFLSWKFDSSARIVLLLVVGSQLI